MKTWDTVFHLKNKSFCKINTYLRTTPRDNRKQFSVPSIWENVLFHNPKNLNRGLTSSLLQTPRRHETSWDHSLIYILSRRPYLGVPSSVPNPSPWWLTGTSFLPDQFRRNLTYSRSLVKISKQTKKRGELGKKFERH